MESNLNQSLLNEQPESLLNSRQILPEQQSLLGTDGVPNVDDAPSMLDDEQRNAVLEEAKQGPRKLTPDEQAQIVFENYIRNTQRFLSGKEKRRLLRECQRNAKKGRYNYMFDPEIQARKQERAKASFEKMNKPSKAAAE